MSMFEIEEPTKCKIVDVQVLSQKNREPDDLPGAKLSVHMSMSNDLLAYFDGLLKGWLFTKNGGPGGQKGLELTSDMPDLTKIGARLGWFQWHVDLTGYTFEIDRGMGGASNLVIADSTLSGWRFLCKEGGTVDAKFDIESANVSKLLFGELATLKSREVDAMFTPPDPSAQPAGADEAKARKRGGKKADAVHAGEAAKDATQQFIERNTAGAAH